MAYQDEEKQIRECKKCGKVKRFEDFEKRIRCNHGISWRCISCKSNDSKKYNSDQIVKEKTKEVQRLYRKNNPEKMLEKSRKYEQENKDKLKKRRYEYNRKPNVVKRRSDRYFNNIDKIKKERKIYRSTDKAKHIKNKRERERKLDDKNYKIRVMLRSRLSTLLKKNSVDKNESAMDLLGCSIEFFIKHIESHFEKGMTWDNHGKFGWHFDHYIPCSSFDLTDLEQQKKCFHYSNIKPMWWRDNLSKGAKLDWRPNK